MIILSLVVTQYRVVGVVCVSVLVIASVSQISCHASFVASGGVPTPSVTHHTIFIARLLCSALSTTVWEVFGLDADLSHSAEVE